MRSNLLIFIFTIFLSIGNISNTIASTGILKITSDKIDYSQDEETLNAVGNVKIIHENGIEIKTSKVTYYKKDGLVKIETQFELTDKNKLSIVGEQLLYDINQQLITAEKNVILKDEKNNLYFFSKIITDDKFINILGNDLETELEKKSDFKDSRPRLKAKKVNIKNNLSTYHDVIFTTCREENKTEGCPYWNLKADEIVHNKSEKNLTYKNAKLELNEIPVLFTPYFSHPDPTVQRKSGFLSPTFLNLGPIGNTIRIPYFFAMSENKDLTLTPIHYFNQHPLLLAEYREKFKNRDFSMEGGFTQGYKKTNSTYTSGSRHHLFAHYNQSFTNKVLDNDNLNIKVQKVNNPTYLKVNQINSKDDKFKRTLIKEGLTELTNEIKFDSYSSNQKLNVRIAANQNIGISKKSDQYQYVYPEINFQKSNLLNETFYQANINSTFRQINSNTNQNKSSVINNFNVNSEDYYLNNGIGYKFLGQIKNINYLTNSNNPEKNAYAQIDPILGLDVNYLLGKKHEIKQEYLTPRILTRYSPGKMKNAKNNDFLLTTDNVFSLDRMGNEELVEKNLSFNLGFDWFLKDDKKKNDSPKTELSVAKVIKFDEDLDMPTKSTLDKKKSDYVTKFSYSRPGNFEVTSKNNLSDNLKDLNYNDINLKTFFNKSFVSLNFVEKNFPLGSERKYGATLTSPITSNLNIKFESEKNLKTDQFIKNSFLVEYINECIQYGLTIKKSYYSNKDLRPGTTIFFGFTLLPFGESVEVFKSSYQ